MRSAHTYLPLLIIILMGVTPAILGYECIHDKINQNVSLAFSDTSSYRNLQSGATPQPIRITADFTFLHTLPQNARIYLTKAMKTAIKRLNQMLKVIPVQGNLKFPSSKSECGASGEMYQIPSIDQTEGIPNSDLHIYVRYTNYWLDDYLAYAINCVLDSSSNRPIFGVVNINYYKFEDRNFSEPKYFTEDTNTFMHEIVHILGFSSSLYSYWRNPTTNQQYESKPTTNQIIRGYSTILINSPNIVEVTKNYYNCQNLLGMQLENQGDSGTAGSHWERTIIQNEFMTGTSLPDLQSFSVFTLALLKDTGWYQVDYGLADQIFWGKGQGCSFFEQACQSSTVFEEFKAPSSTQSNRPGCSYDGLGSATHDSETYSDNCKYMKLYSNKQCSHYTGQTDFSGSTTYPVVLGTNSKCFISNLIEQNYVVPNLVDNFRCLQYECANSNTQLYVYVGVNKYLCSSGGMISEATYTHNGQTYKGSIQCPTDISRFCQQQPCPNHCSGNGYCAQSQCQCLENYSGADCKQYTSTCLLSYCLECNSQNQSQCLACDESSGYYLNSSLQCMFCDFSNGYFVNRLEKKYCEKCSTNCIKCSSSTYCLKCASYSLYLLYSADRTTNQCVYTCGNYYYPSSGVCQSCMEGCEKCTKLSSCDVCVQTYARVQYQYSFSSRYECKLCGSWEYLTVDQNCESCISNCNNCTTSDNCFSCYSGYYLITNSSTQKPECLYCGTTGKYLEGQDCANCKLGCDSCNSSTNCLSCSSSYYTVLDEQRRITNCIQCNSSSYFGGSSCISCPNGCLSCKSSQKCDQCKYDFEEIKKDGMVFCKDKSQGDDIKIAECNPVHQYRIDLTHCGDCLQNCEKCNSSDICSECNTYSKPMINQYDQIIKCNACPSGQYYNASGVCNNCKEGCLLCLEQDNCNACHRDYSQTYYQSSNYVNCTKNFDSILALPKLAIAFMVALWLLLGREF